ncbi:MAG: hypothetical protein ACRDNK_24170 [Solirubrobacteraceae bacterium]
MRGAFAIESRWTPRRETLLVTLVYAAYAVFLSWPLVTDLAGLLAGPGTSGDTGGGVGQVAYVVQHHIFPFAPGTFSGVNAPQGLAQPWVLNIVSLPSNTVLFGLSYSFGAVAGSNLFMLLGFVLSGTSMFLLTRRLFRSSGAAALAGFAFAFYPFAVDKINGHFQYMNGFALVVGVWRMLELIDRPSTRNALLAGAAAAFGMWWTPYFILIGGVGFAVMEVVLLAVGMARHQGREVIRVAAVATLPILGLLGALGALTVLAGSAASGTIRTQDLQELYTYSARWLEWLLPDRHNLLFGGLTSRYLTEHLHGSNFSESSLYLGLSVAVFAAGGVAMAARRMRAAGRLADQNLGLIAALAGGLLALVAAWFSSPPTVHVLGVWLPTPSDLIYKITSTWRVYTRFVELIELGLCLSMAYAITQLVRHQTARRSAAVLIGLAVILVVDLWSRPPVRTVSVSPPPEYVWLRDHPGGIVADYPLYPAVYPDYAPMFWQMDDRHPLFQGYGAASYDESKKLDLVDLAEPKTAPDLASYGVRYIVVRPGVPGGDPKNLTKQHYVLRFASADASVWEVRAAPAPSLTDALSNFSPIEGPPRAEYRWMAGTGVLGVLVRNCRACHGEVTFESSSSRVPRALTVRNKRSGQILTRATIPAGKTDRIVVPNVLVRDGSALLELSTTPGPAIPLNGDPRLLSILVQEPHFTRLETRR